MMIDDKYFFALIAGSAEESSTRLYESSWSHFGNYWYLLF